MSTLATDRFYYIMDYSCNYYRVDSMNQLVAVGNENDATVFSFSEADKRIGSGGKSKFYYMTHVEMQKEDTQDLTRFMSRRRHTIKLRQTYLQ